MFLHADSEDSDQTGQMPICPVWSKSSLGAKVILLVLSCGGSFESSHEKRDLTLCIFRSLKCVHNYPVGPDLQLFV